MKLHYHPYSNNCRRVIAVIRHLGLAVQLKVIDFEQGEHQSKAFLKLNRNGKVPVLEAGDFVLSESNAIMAYLASESDSDLWPKDNRRYDIMRWFNWEAAHFQCQAVGLVGYQRLVMPMFGGTPDEAVIEAGEKGFERYASVLDGHLSEHDWLVGDTVTLADFAVGSDVDLGVAAQLPVDHYPHIITWYDRLNGLPAWRDSAPQM